MLRLALFMLIGVIFTGCSSPKQSNVIEPQKSEVSYKYNKKVIPQTKKSLSYIKDVSERTITYSKDTPSKYIPKPDDIISSGINNVFPYGIGVIVTDVQTLPNGDIECTTTPAKLDQIFDELKINSYTDLLSAEDNQMTLIDDSGNEIQLEIVSESQLEKQRAAVNKDYLFIYPTSIIDFLPIKKRIDRQVIIPFHTGYQVNPDEFDVKIKKLPKKLKGHNIPVNHSLIYNFDGEVNTGLGLIFECDLKSKTYKLALDANCGYEITEWLLDYYNDGGISYPFSEKLFHAKTPAPYRINLGYITLAVSLDFSVTADVFTSGYFKSHASKQVGIEVGITQNGVYDNPYKKGNDKKLLQIDSLNANIGASISLSPSITVGLFDQHLASGELAPYVKFGAETNCVLEDENIFKKNPTFKLFAKGGIDASFNFFDFKESLISLSKSGSITSFDIWEKGWPMLPVLDSKSVSIVPKKSGEKYIMSFNFSSDGIIQKWKDNMKVGAIITAGDSLIQKQPVGEGDIISAKQKYKYTFDNLSLEMYKSFMAKPEIVWNGRIYYTNGIAFAVNGVTFNTKDYYIKSVKYYGAYSDDDYGCDFWNRDHYHYYHDLIFEVEGSDRCAEIGNQCTTDDYHKELSLSLHDGILKGQYVYMTTEKVNSFMVETVPYAYMLNGERLTFEPYQFRLWRDESIVDEWYK